MTMAQKCVSFQAYFFLFPIDLEIFGLTMLEGLPSERDTVTKFAWEKFGYPQFTQYGDSFEVMNKSGPSNVAYTGKTLGLHLDQPIYTNRWGKLGYNQGYVHSSLWGWKGQFHNQSKL